MSFASLLEIPSVSRLTGAQYDFATKLYGEFSQLNQSFVVSPYAVLIAPSMCYMASDDNERAKLRPNIFSKNVDDEQIEVDKLCCFWLIWSILQVNHWCDK